MTCYLRAFDEKGNNITDRADEFKSLKDARREIRYHYQHAYRVDIYNYETNQLYEYWLFQGYKPKLKIEIRIRKGA